MALTKLSSESQINSYTIIDNMFITDYLPNADEMAIKVYMHGLFQCANKTGRDNTLEGVSLALGVSTSEVENALKYWENLGVIRVTCESPLSYEYLPLKTGNVKVKKYDPEKYRDFITQLEGLIMDRVMTPNELMKYVEVIEEYKLDQNAMLMIASHCTHLKGNKVHTNYILTVAKSWANEGVKDIQSAELKLRELEANTDNMRQVFYALGLRSTPDFEDKQYFIKWNTSWGYDLEIILYVAKLCKRRGGIKKLDKKLDGFYRLGLFTLPSIVKNAEYIEYTRNLSVQINKALGTFYENVEPVMENYVVPWLEKGYDGKGLLTIIKFCFLRNNRQFPGVNEFIDTLYNNGVISNTAIDEYIAETIHKDKRIKHILTTLGSSRMVSGKDRDYYNTWSDMWAFSTDIIDYAVSLSVGKSHSFAYINSVLASWHNLGLKTLEDCKKNGGAPTGTYTKPSTQDFSGQRTYTKEELDQIYGNLEDESRFIF